MIDTTFRLTPRIAIVNPNVCSPLTCRFNKHGVCQHQQAATVATTTQAAAAAQPLTKTQAAAKLTALESQFQTILLKIGHALLKFPEAKVAVNAILRDLRSLTPNPMDSAQPAEVP